MKYSFNCYGHKNITSKHKTTIEFTKDEDLDFRPAGGIIEYDKSAQTGRINLFRVEEGYDPSKFIASVRGNPLWADLAEAQKQIRYLEGGKL